MWENRSKMLFFSSVFTAGVILSQMAMYLAHVLFGWRLSFNVFQLCGNWIRSSGFFFVEYVLDALVMSTFALFLWALAQQICGSYRAFRKIQACRNDPCTHEMNVRFAGGKQELIVVSHPQPIAFTAGFLRPTIVLSTGLLELLDDSELEAVVRHELFHKRSRDPLATFVTLICARALWYIPILKWCHHHYKISREILADHYAMRTMGSSVALGSALLKLLKKDRPDLMAFAHVSFADTSMNYRIRQILDPQAEIPFRIPLTPAVISLKVVVGLTALFIPIL